MKKVTRILTLLLRRKKPFVISLYAVSLVMLLLVTALFGVYIGRNRLLHHYLDPQISRIEKRYGLHIHYQRFSFDRLNVISVRNLYIVPEERDTLLLLHEADFHVNLWKLIRRNPEISRMDIDGLHIDFIKNDTIANYDFLFRKNGSSHEPTTEVRDYAHAVNRMVNLFFGFLPESGKLQDFCLRERLNENYVTVRLPLLLLHEGHFSTSFEIQEDTIYQKWRADGMLDQHRQSFHGRLFNTSVGKIQLPYLHRRFQADVAFDTLYCSLSSAHPSHKQVDLQGNAVVKGLEVYQPALSPDIIHFCKQTIGYVSHVYPDAFELDSASTVTCNRLSFHPYIYARKKGKWHIRASVNKDWFSSDDLFSSLPQGLFSNLQGLRTQGRLRYHFLADIDFAQLDSLRFESDLQRDHFRIVSYGKTSLSKMSSEFLYTAYERGVPVRTFPVGPSWEHFTPLDSVPQLLQTAILQSEDGSFFQHQGFRIDAMREALIYDLEKQRFARGGSTISMQLVKNVFLNRNKNIARKLEEALIVWLIETQGLTSKHRMYEVYLNIAEWGPLVYGIHEAAAFYFDKRPSQLTLEESIFLASIIPKPKHYRSSFTAEGVLKESLSSYYRQIARRLEIKGLISDTVCETITPEVELKGAARNAVVSAECADTLTLSDDEP